MKYSDPELLQYWEAQFIQFLSHQENDDASHDFSHFQRVWKTARQIMERECQSVNPLVVLAACYFHDIVVLPKNHPDRARASTLAAEEAGRCLSMLDFPESLRSQVCHAIMAHSYSAGINPETIEAKVVQDADRMEALGAIGLARVFYTAGILKQKLFDPVDPLAENRCPDDRLFALDHFQLKLLKIAETMQTAEGRRLAQSNTGYLTDFIDKLCKELRGDYSPTD
ncbi:phosphohydrolase [Endozoicomonas sp. Mp262]|uniref:phosphohydrolase n=1 Tax=Endozoicomonas sp. Mp262 TaxID=2919499 RepID=UPI0021D8EBBA